MTTSRSTWASSHGTLFEIVTNANVHSLIELKKNAILKRTLLTGVSVLSLLASGWMDLFYSIQNSRLDSCLD